MNSGIYKIVCLANDKIYIGSRKNLIEAKSKHFSLLKYNKHHNSHLQNAYNKYGLKNFEFHIVEYCEIENLIEREQHYIDTLNPEFNIARKAGNTLGIKKSIETRFKMAEAQRGVNHHFYGKHHTEEWKKIVSQKLIGQKRDVSFCEKMKKYQRNRSKFTEDDVLEIRRLREEGNWTLKNIANKFDSNISTIKDICLYQTWKDVK